ncbi:MAG: cache domain-containing protein [Gammaproteobacteria bacterium]
MPHIMEGVRQNLAENSANYFSDAIARQREMLTDLLTVPMYKTAHRLAPLIDLRSALEFLLIGEIEQLSYCRFLYVLDAEGRQITANIGRDGADRSHYARNRADREYMENIIGFSDFRLSNAYISKNNRRPSITAIQVIRDHNMQRIGYLGADFDLRELPHTGAVYSEIRQWRQLKGDPAIRGGLFQQQRVDSVLDEYLSDVLILMNELLTERGVFHGKLHFSSNRATVWLTDDPFHYRLLSLEELTNPDICLAYSPRPYPDTALVPLQDVMPVLELFKTLRFMDENIYLRSGSLNIFNGMVGLNFSCDGSHYMNYRKFLTSDMQFWIGQRCAV